MYRANLKEKSYLEGLALCGMIIVQFILWKSCGVVIIHPVQERDKRISREVGKETSYSLKGEEFLG